jgi:hypothetical protein
VGLANLGSDSEMCVGSSVHLVGVSISFEKNFYRLPFTSPPLWFAVSVLQWDGFPSSQFDQINSLKRKTLGTSFSLFKLPLKFSDRRRKSKRSFPGKTGANRRRGPIGPVGPGRPAHPVLGAGFPCTALFSLSQPMGKSWPSKSSRETLES